MRALWNNKNYLKLWFGQSVSIIGDQLHFIALMVLIQETFGNIIITGSILMVSALPKVLFSPFAGVLIDRWSLKRTMVISDLLRMVLVLLIPFMFYYLELTNMTLVLVITFLISTVSVFFYPAKSASIPTLVEKENLLKANSLSGTTQMVLALFGLLGGALLVAIIGTTTAFIIDSITFLISAIFIALIKFPQKDKSAKKESLSTKVYLKELKQGANYIVNNQILRFMLSFFAAIMLLGGALNVLLFAYVEEVLKQDASYIGYLMSANMVGMIIGIALIPKITKRYPKEKLLVWSTLIFAIAISSLAFTTNEAIVLSLMVVQGLGNGILNIVASTMFQEYIDENMRGRVFSVIDATVNSAAMLSMLPAAWLAQTFGVTNVVLTIAVLIFIIFVISLKKVNIIYNNINSEKELLSESAS